MIRVLTAISWSTGGDCFCQQALNYIIPILDALPVVKAKGKNLGKYVQQCKRETCRVLLPLWAGSLVFAFIGQTQLTHFPAISTLERKKMLFFIACFGFPLLMHFLLALLQDNQARSGTKLWSHCQDCKGKRDYKFVFEILAQNLDILDLTKLKSIPRIAYPAFQTSK